MHLPSKVKAVMHTEVITTWFVMDKSFNASTSNSQVGIADHALVDGPESDAVAVAAPWLSCRLALRYSASLSGIFLDPPRGVYTPRLSEHTPCDVYVGGKVRVLEFMIFLTLQHNGSK